MIYFSNQNRNKIAACPSIGEKFATSYIAYACTPYSKCSNLFSWLIGLNIPVKIILEHAPVLPLTGGYGLDPLEYITDRSFLRITVHCAYFQPHLCEPEKTDNVVKLIFGFRLSTLKNTKPW